MIIVTTLTYGICSEFQEHISQRQKELELLQAEVSRLQQRTRQEQEEQSSRSLGSVSEVR